MAAHKRRLGEKLIVIVDEKQNRPLATPGDDSRRAVGYFS
jgi:hypothetical protein